MTCKPNFNEGIFNPIVPLSNTEKRACI